MLWSLILDEANNAVHDALSHQIGSLGEHVAVVKHEASLDDGTRCLIVNLVKAVVVDHVISDAVGVKIHPGASGVALRQASDQPTLRLRHQAILNTGDLKPTGWRGGIGVGHAGIGMDGDERIGSVVLQARIVLRQQVSLVAECPQGVDDPLGDVEVDLDLSQAIGAHGPLIVFPVTGDDADVWSGSGLAS